MQVSSKQVDDAHSVNLSCSLQGGLGPISSPLHDETSMAVKKVSTRIDLMDISAKLFLFENMWMDDHEFAFRDILGGHSNMNRNQSKSSIIRLMGYCCP